MQNRNHPDRAPWISVLALSLVAAAGAAQQATPAPPAHPEANHAVTSPGNAEWAPDVAFAKKRAAAQHKLVYYEIGGETLQRLPAHAGTAVPGLRLRGAPRSGWCPSR